SLAAPPEPQRPPCPARACSRKPENPSSAQNRQPGKSSQGSPRWRIASSLRRLLRGCRGQPPLDNELHRLVAGNPHDARVPIHPAVRRQDAVLVFSQSDQIAPWIALKPRLWWQRLRQLLTEAIDSRSPADRAAGEIEKHAPDDQVDQRGADE